MKDPNQIVSVHPKTGRTHVETINNEPSMTQQQFREEADINNIMARYTNTGEFLHLTKQQGQYADFSQITDYQEMLNAVKYADEAFASLPALVRKKFSNNPEELLTFLQQSSNYDEGVTLGLLNPRPIPVPPPIKPEKPV